MLLEWPENPMIPWVGWTQVRYWTDCEGPLAEPRGLWTVRADLGPHQVLFGYTWGWVSNDRYLAMRAIERAWADDAHLPGVAESWLLIWGMDE